MERDIGLIELRLATPSDVSNVLAAHCADGYILSGKSHDWRECLIRDGIEITSDDRVGC